MVIAADETLEQPDVLSNTVIVYDPGASPLNVVPAWNVVPSILYVYCAPSGESTMIVPLGVVHVGCVTGPSVGTVGAPGAASMVTLEDAIDVQPSLLITVKV
jgi:hypothetical protein